MGDNVRQVEFERSDRLAPTGKAVAELPLTPEDYFVLSRVDGRSTVAEIIAASGLPTSDASAILGKLHQLGAVRALDGSGTGPADARGGARGVAGGDDPRAMARERRRAALRSQLAATAAQPTTATAGGDRSPGTAERAVEDPGAAAPEDLTGLPRVALVAEDDPRLAPDLDVPIDEQRLLWAAHDRIEALDHFELLGLEPTDDKKRLRRAYHLVSRHLHPDRYYQRRVGALGPVLQALFHRAKSSFEALMRDEVRVPLVQRYEARKRQEAERVRAAEAAVAAVARDQSEAARRAAEAERRAELAERATRDATRRARVHQRVMLATRAQRTDRARSYVEQGRAELGRGRPGNAANLFRLALEVDPDDAEVRELWQRSLGTARKDRAAHAYDQGLRLLEVNQPEDAARLLLEAAEADPRVEHLAEAAYAMREQEPARARELAMAALEALASARASGVKIDRPTQGRVHLCAAHAFVAAGQHHSARQQLEAAQALLGDHASVRALLKLIKKA